MWCSAGDQRVSQLGFPLDCGSQSPFDGILWELRHNARLLLVVASPSSHSCSRATALSRPCFAHALRQTAIRRDLLSPLVSRAKPDAEHGDHESQDSLAVDDSLVTKMSKTGYVGRCDWFIWSVLKGRRGNSEIACVIRWCGVYMTSDWLAARLRCPGSKSSAYLR